MYKHVLMKERFRFSEVVISIVMLIFAISSCTPTSPASKPPVDPILYAVIAPGSPPTFARKSTSGPNYEVLPSRSVILRLTNSFPESWEAIKIILKYRNGSVSDRLQYVRVDDIPQQQALDSKGFYEVAADSYGYSVIVVPPASERRGPGFDIAMTNIASNPPAGVSAESHPLNVGILPVASRTNPSDVFFDCGNDFQNFYGDWHYNCKEGASIVLRDFTLEGWLVSLEPNCLDGLCVEDFHYNFIPNPDFIDAFYGPHGMFPALIGSDPFAGVKFPGDPAQPSIGQLSFQDIDLSTGRSKGVNINSFILPVNAHDPQNDMITFKSELNAWHINDQGNAFSRHWKGRGSAPDGWIQNVVPPDNPSFDAWGNTRWPYIPENPDGGATNLQAGDYVRVNGVLWQDSSHLIPGWETALPGHGGWLEIHPPDWIERIPTPPIKKSPILVQFINVPGSSNQKNVTVKPDVSPQPGEVLRCRELIDGRLTNTGITRTVNVSPQGVTVSLSITAPGGRFKAVYLVWWEHGSNPDTTCS